jgi:hypothetical protein
MAVDTSLARALIQLSINDAKRRTRILCGCLLAMHATLLFAAFWLPDATYRSVLLSIALCLALFAVVVFVGRMRYFRVIESFQALWREDRLPK